MEFNGVSIGIVVGNSRTRPMIGVNGTLVDGETNDDDTRFDRQFYELLNLKWSVLVPSTPDKFRKDLMQR